MSHLYKTRRDVNKGVLIGACVLGLLAISACDSQSDRPNSSTPLERAIEPQLDALEKAKNVEDSLQDQVEERDKAMRDQGT